MVRSQQPDQANVNKHGVLLGQNHQGKGQRVRSEIAPIIWMLKIFPKQPQTKRCPKDKEAVDQRVLRHVDLGRRTAHQRGKAKRNAHPGQAPREKRREKQEKNTKDARHRLERAERVSPEDLMPQISAKNVKEPRWWKNGARKLTLNCNVLFRQIRI